MENYEELCELGYDFIELAGIEVMKMREAELAEAQKLIVKNNIPCNGFNAYCGAGLSMAGPHCDIRAAQAYAAEICRRGKTLGIRVIGLGAPLARRIPKDFDRRVAAGQIREFVRATAEEGAKHGIVFLFEALNPHICDLVTHTREALEIVRELDMPNLRMVLDFHHLTQSGEDVSDIAYVMPYVRHLHIDHTREGGRYHLKEEGIPFYSRCIEAVRACAYNGTLAIEPTVTAAPFREEAEESLRILRSLL
ncbi:MAG: sugar phosphate isomerase/epimerase [Spirochaetaceae bacterium]|nr:sugar phosphate isomerase/epimerase [Spirochaetaceae bacterium]